MDGGNNIRTRVVEGSGSAREDTVYVTFDATATSGILYFSAHIASELDRGPATGASSISGSSYHVSKVSLNCVVKGASDLSIKTAGMQVGFVTVVKKATPADGTDFNFNLSSEEAESSANFELDDSSDSDTGENLPNQIKYNVAPGEVTISEGVLPAGWNLADLTCSGVAPTVDKTKRLVSFTLLNRVEVVCTFTNTKTTYKDLAVSKTAKPRFDRDYDWTIDKNLAAGQDAGVKSPTTNVNVNYSVLVKASAAKDSNFVVDGVITVENSNSTAINGVTLSDSLPGAECAIETAGGTAVTGPISIPNGTTNYNYT